LPLTMVYDRGDKVYYPKLSFPSDQEMTVWDRHIGRGRNGWYAQYCCEELLDCLVEDMHRNLEQHNDNVVVITGPEKGTGEGVGKSNLAYWVAKKFDPDFSIERDYVYDVRPFLEKIAAGNLANKVLWLDEGTNLLSARNWMTETNKSVDQMLEMFRSYMITLIICIPKLYRLDEYVRESRMRYHLTCDIRYWDYDRNPKRGYFELRKEPDFKTVSWGKFPKIPEEEDAIYQAIKKRSQEKKAKEMLEKFEDSEKGGSRLQKSAKYNRKLAWMLKMAGYSYDEISEETGIPKGTLKSWISENKEELEDD